MKRTRGGLLGRCPDCLINKNFCFCGEIKEHNLAHKISIIMHVTEKKLTSNTAWLAEKMIDNCDIHIRGQVYNTFKAEEVLDCGYHPVFLFPTEDSMPLTEDILKELEKPLQILVPDGNWHQAKKVKNREPMFKNIQAVHLKEKYESIYTLRRPPFKGALCTAEAISYAIKDLGLGVVHEDILRVLGIMVDRTQQTRIGYSHPRDL